MIYKGVCAALRQEVGQAGNNQYFQWVEQQYGADHARFVSDVTRTLRELGFNGFGGWSFLFTPRTGFRDQGMPFVEILPARELAGKEACVPGANNVDVFDPAFARTLDKRCSQVCAELRDHPGLLCYYSDNESTYAQPQTDAAWTGKLEDLQKPPPAPLLLQLYLAMDAKRAGHQFAWRWVLERHGGSVAQLSRDWQIEFADAGKLRELTDQKVVFATAGYSADHAAFTRLYVLEFYRQIHDAVRRYDPNHLIATTRHPAPPGLHVLSAERECFDRGWIDILAMNNYRIGFRERLMEYDPTGKMPILNGEFSWTSGGFLDWSKYLRCEGFSEAEKDAVRVRAVAALENAFTHPSLIGYTFFKWYCGAEFARWDYGLDATQPVGGVVTNHGQINQFNAELFRQLHPRLEGIATGTIEPVSAAGLDPVPQTLTK
jgi:hypothetical protein